MRKLLFFKHLNYKCMNDSGLQLRVSIAALVAYIEVIRPNCPETVVAHLETIVSNMRAVCDEYFS